MVYLEMHSNVVYGYTSMVEGSEPWGGGGG